MDLIQLLPSYSIIGMGWNKTSWNGMGRASGTGINEPDLYLVDVASFFLFFIFIFIAI